MIKVCKTEGMQMQVYFRESQSHTLPEGEKKCASPSFSLFFTLANIDHLQTEPSAGLWDCGLLLMYMFHIFLSFCIQWFSR